MHNIRAYLCLLTTTQLGKDMRNTLTFCVSNSSQSVACVHTDEPARYIANYESDARTARCSHV